MSELKDKKICVYRIETGRNEQGNEIKTKRYIHNLLGLWAYARDLTDRERFAANAAGAQQTIVFKVNYNSRITAGMYIEFLDRTYKIESVDNNEFYKRILIIRAYETLPEVTENETYDE